MARPLRIKFTGAVYPVRESYLNQLSLASSLISRFIIHSNRPMLRILEGRRFVRRLTIVSSDMVKKQEMLSRPIARPTVLHESSTGRMNVCNILTFIVKTLRPYPAHGRRGRGDDAIQVSAPIGQRRRKCAKLDE